MLGTGMFEVLLVIVVALACVALAATVAVLARRPRPLADRSEAPVRTETAADGGWAEHQEARRQAGVEAAELLSRTAEEAAVVRTAAETQAQEVRTRADANAAILWDRARAEAVQLRIQAEQDAVGITQRAETEASEVRRRAEAAARHALDARDDAEAETRVLKEDQREQRVDLERREQRLTEREERLDADGAALAERTARLLEREDAAAADRAALTDLVEERRRVLEQAAGLSAAQAHSELVRGIETQAKREAALLVRSIEGAARAEGEDRARHIVVDAIARVASEQTSESVVSVLHLPSDDMKGRIIGREGRNIRAFESVTGVNVIIDDTPEAVLLSCFDPVRREIARLTLEALVLDGRIHPHRIEEVYERSRIEVDRLCLRAGEDAQLEVGVTEIHPELTALLGRLRYRTSYGQNVLKHLVETAHIAGLMAAELHLDPVLVKRGAFLHDIGKALTHEVEGSHAAVGADLARRYGESDEVVHAIEAHHNEVAPVTLEAVLTQAADACSGGRPGARRESLESYVKRLERIEEIGRAHEGVEKVFCMQAGREVRVMVLPEAVDDIGAQVLARDIAKQVEEELTYPGQIRVTVVRESRATELAR